MFKIKKITSTLIISLAIQLTTVDSAIALPFLSGISIKFDLPDPIAEIFQDFTRIVGEIETILSELGIDVPLGDLGLPDLESAEIEFENNNEIDVIGDIFGSQTGSTFDLKDKLYQQYLNDLSSEFSLNSALSLEGQEKIKEQIESSEEILESSEEIASSSNLGLLSQRILLRNISQQLSLQQRLDNMMFFESQEDKIARALSLSLSGETLLELSKQSTRAQRETTSIYKTALYDYGLLSIPGQYLLNE